MYNMDSDKYTCDYCNREFSWDGEDYGNIWECEKCGKHFCTECFIKIAGTVAFMKMQNEGDKVLCPECYKEDLQD